MYRTSDKPVHLASNSSDIFGGTSDEDLAAYHKRMRADRAHANRSRGQKVRHARERLYGKESHVVSVRPIPGWEPKA